MSVRNFIARRFPRFARFTGLTATSIGVANSAAQAIVAIDKKLDDHEAQVGVHQIALKGQQARKRGILADYQTVHSNADDLLASL